MTRAIWAQRARYELAAIDDYYRDLAPDYAVRVGRLAIQAGDFLAERPHAGPAIETLGARKWRIRDTPYVLIYMVVRTGVEIVSVRHAAEDWRPE